MIIGGLNYLVVVLAGAAGWIAGAVWYGVLGNHWVAALGKTMDEFKGEQAALKGSPASYLPYILAFIGNVVMAGVLAGLLSHFGPGQANVKNGIAIAVFAWLGFVLTTITVNNAFAGRKHKLTLIDAGHWLVVLLIMGAIIGWKGVR